VKKGIVILSTAQLIAKLTSGLNGVNALLHVVEVSDSALVVSQCLRSLVVRSVTNLSKQSLVTYKSAQLIARSRCSALGLVVPNLAAVESIIEPLVSSNIPNSVVKLALRASMKLGLVMLKAVQFTARYPNGCPGQAAQQNAVEGCVAEREKSLFSHRTEGLIALSWTSRRNVIPNLVQWIA